jgi:subtilisin family serine protease
MERLAPQLANKINSRIIHPVIIETEANRFSEIFEELKPFAYTVNNIVDRFSPAEPQFYFLNLMDIPMFNMIACVLPREVIEDYAEDKRVAKIYPDNIMWALQYPTVTEEGVYKTIRGREKKEIQFTSTAWTKRLIGADKANSKGFTGKGVKVAVLDTGSSATHPQLRGKLLIPHRSPYPLPTLDRCGHGCIRGAYIYTSFCGVQRIEDMWNLVDVKPINTADGGELKPFPHEVYTVGRNGVVKVEGVYRCRSKKVRIHTPLGVVESTPWHRFMAVRPVKGPVKGDSHRRWYAGYEVMWKRADELEAPKESNQTDADYLLVKPYDGESWSLGLDQKVALLAGYFFGDAVVLLDSVNVKNGKVYTRSSHHRTEVQATDDDLSFLKTVAEICRELGAKGVSVKEYKEEKAYLLSAYGKEFVAKITPFVINPPINDLEAMRAWVAGFFDAEGYVDFERKRVKIASTKKPILEKLSSFLTAVGIPSKVASGGTSKGSTSYHLLVLDAKAFYKFVEPYVIKKKDKLFKLSETARVNAKVVKRVGDFIALRVNKVDATDEEDYFYDLANSSDSTYLANGIISHNSWCASCVAGRQFVDDVLSRASGKVVICEGMAPDATVIPIKVLDFVVGMGSTSAIIKGVEIALKEGAGVLNLSLGGPEDAQKETDDPQFKAFEKAKEYNVISCVAAGNDGPKPGTVGSPGALSNVLTVGAYDPITGEVAEYSSRGPVPWGSIKPDCIAPGGGAPQNGIDSAIDGTLDMAGDNIKNRFSPIQGTSMATPHVSGLVALMREAHAKLLGKILTLEEVLRMLESLGHSKSNDDGYGLISWDMYCNWMSTEYGIEL